MLAFLALALALTLAASRFLSRLGNPPVDSLSRPVAVRPSSLTLPVQSDYFPMPVTFYGYPLHGAPCTVTVRDTTGNVIGSVII